MPSLPVKPTLINLSSPPYTIEARDNVYYSPAFPKNGNLKSLSEVWYYILPGNYSITESLNLKITVTMNGEEIYNENFISADRNQILEIMNIKPSVSITKGKCKIVYDVSHSYQFSNDNQNTLIAFTLTYDLYITENTEPLPKWNAWTVCERMLNIAETIRQGDKPRFKLDQSQRAWLESIETPEFQFTQSTLRECLQGVGAFIHAEPRLLPNEDNDGYQGVVHFDRYGGNEESEFAETYTNYGLKSVSQNIESFATNIDSSVDNFVNSINYASKGSLIEPYNGGYKTVLAEGSYVRITDESMYIATQYPIRSIKSLKLGWLLNY